MATAIGGIISRTHRRHHFANHGRQFSGTIIGGVMPNSPAAKAGLSPKDIIQSFDGKTINGPRKLQSIVERLEVGKTYPVKIRRDGKQQTVKVTVAEMPATSDRIRQRFRERKRQPKNRQPE